MCIYCKNFQGDAAIWNCPTHEQLTKMNKISTDKDGMIVVKCDKFERLTVDSSMIIKG